MEDQYLDSYWEDQNELQLVNELHETDYTFNEVEQGMYDDDPSPYDGTYSEE